jgi:NAD dependent epimerase/dehydratase family enzyme
LLPVPAPALRLAYGQMADETLLSSARAVPEKLEQSDYRFRQPDLEQALRFVLGRNREASRTEQAESPAPAESAAG